MHPVLSTSYLVPGILLNPVLFLWSLNTLLSRLLPPITIDAAIQPPPYYPRGPSAEHPHLDIHASEKLCWSYTTLIVCANLAAFGKVSERRRAAKARARDRKERVAKGALCVIGDGVTEMGRHKDYTDSSMSWATDGAADLPGHVTNRYDRKIEQRDSPADFGEYSDTTDSEIVL
ncbi:hypothetical protein MMC21_006098 [Puttea exsequens]|nr:hypothetical protein [Puttea exsequens]